MWDDRNKNLRQTIITVLDFWKYIVNNFGFPETLTLSVLLWMNTQQFKSTKKLFSIVCQPSDLYRFECLCTDGSFWNEHWIQSSPGGNPVWICDMQRPNLSWKQLTCNKLNQNILDIHVWYICICRTANWIKKTHFHLKSYICPKIFITSPRSRIWAPQFLGKDSKYSCQGRQWLSYLQIYVFIFVTLSEQGVCRVAELNQHQRIYSPLSLYLCHPACQCVCAQWSWEFSGWIG